MGQMKTPGVYIVEKSAFPNSVVEVDTAVPAFIGYTEKADNKGMSLLNKPWRITSLAEYHEYFGADPTPRFEIGVMEDKAVKKKPKKESDEKSPPEEAASTEKTLAPTFTYDGTDYLLNQKDGPEGGKYLFYYSMLLFFQNGGGPCYIVSVGNYSEDIEMDRLQNGIDLLIKEQEPTMVLIPEAVLLDQENCISLQQASLGHCGGKMKNRISILDVWDGYKDRKDPPNDCIAEFRNRLGINYLDYAAAYYPWVNTTILQDKDLSYENIANIGFLQKILKAELNIPDKLKTGESPKLQQQKQTIDNLLMDWSKAKPTLKADEIKTSKMLLNKSLIAMSPLFNIILREIKNKLNLLPPSSAMAGIYTMVDNESEVWKAPANVSLNAVISPSVNITHDDQEDLNVTPQGKSVNAIRTFIGEGTLVWGARTLDGNSLDWRYINVRRTMIMLEESIKLATKAYVFENNDANTWVTIGSMISNFLTGIWKRGGLAGATTEDAFSVHVGLGDTMTPEDILEGILRVTVLVALIRPAEFIEITFQQQMQKS